MNLNGSDVVDLQIKGHDAHFIEKDKKIVFLAGDVGNQDIWTINVDGTDKHQLTGTRGIKTSLCVTSPDTKLFFTHREVGSIDFKVYQMNVDGTKLRLLFILW